MTKKIILTGDSLTDGFKLENYFQGDRLINKGIYGDNTQGVLGRIEKDLEGYDVQMVFVLIGTNDFALGKSNDEILENLKKIIEKIKKSSPGAEIYITTILPVRNLENRKNEIINELNKELAVLTEKESVKFFNLNEKMKDAKGELPEELSEDGLHLTEAGYNIWAEELKKIIS